MQSVDWTGQEVYFGRYPQSGGKVDQKESIEWIVLDEQDDVAVLLSKYGLHTIGYYMGDYSNPKVIEEKLIWEYSTLRKWLNDEFFHAAFSEAEQKQLVEHVIVTDEGTKPEDQKNRVFLLSEEYVRKHLPSDKKRQTQPTRFAVENGARIDMEPKGNCCWWLLPEEDLFFKGKYPKARYPKAVFQNGEIQYHGRNVYHRDFVVRPAIQVSVDTLKKIAAKSRKHTMFQSVSNRRPLWETVPIEPTDLSITRTERYPLDEQKIYFVTAFYAQDALVKWSVDKELANDSHYELSAAAADRLREVLSAQYGGKALRDQLRQFFQENTEYHLVSLLKREHIPFRQFHYYGD